jgi:hypothetical protein
MSKHETIKAVTEIAHDVAHAVHGAVDAKAAVAGTVGLSGFFLDVKELGVWFGEAMPGYLVLATLVYICLGIRNRWKIGKADKEDKD